MLSRRKEKTDRRKAFTEPLPQDKKERNAAVGAVFISAVALLLLVAGYVIHRISSEAAHQRKWEDYDDYGWA